ncbi:MAG: hypothetical protein JOY63_03985 [Acetobacteraceae bacterium]|nr:hypothetical protein [Acetobacteraceae bacterium]
MPSTARSGGVPRQLARLAVLAEGDVVEHALPARSPWPTQRGRACTGASGWPAGSTAP